MPNFIDFQELKDRVNIVDVLRLLVSVREQIESFESVSAPLLKPLNPLPFYPLF